MRILPLIMATILLAPGGAAGDECTKDCTGEIDCEVAMVDCLIKAGRARDAVARVKPLVKAHPDQPAFVHLLARLTGSDTGPAGPKG